MDYEGLPFRVFEVLMCLALWWYFRKHYLPFRDMPSVRYIDKNTTIEFYTEQLENMVLFYKEVIGFVEVASEDDPPSCELKQWGVTLIIQQVDGVSEYAFGKKSLGKRSAVVDEKTRTWWACMEIDESECLSEKRYEQWGLRATRSVARGEAYGVWYSLEMFDPDGNGLHLTHNTHFAELHPHAYFFWGPGYPPSIYR